MVVELSGRKDKEFPGHAELSDECGVGFDHLGEVSGDLGAVGFHAVRRVVDNCFCEVACGEGFGVCGVVGVLPDEYEAFVDI